MSSTTADVTNADVPFFVRHEFAIRRLHSLLGIVPLGLYMCVHLTTNASLLNGPETFQRAVYAIHSLGKLLPVVEWAFIFGPLVFHAVLGVWIVKQARQNHTQYPFTSNRRYAWQRWTGMIALVYLFVHILHLHGWFHFQPYFAAIQSIGLGAFRPYNAPSTLIESMNAFGGIVWPAFYLVGVLCCVYHLANGLWTAGITWGLWITPAAQARATKVSVAFGGLLTVIALSAWWAAVAPTTADAQRAEAIEDRMYAASVEAGVVPKAPEKRSQPDPLSVE